MAIRKNTGQSAQTFAAEAEHQFNELASALRSARASLNSLNRSLRVPVPKGGSRTIRGSRSQASIYERTGTNIVGHYLTGQIISGGSDLFGDLSGGGGFLNLFGNDLADTGSFLPSLSQIAGKFYLASQRAQRVM